MLRLDHLAVSGETLSDAVVHLENCLGVETVPGGQHPHFATHNRLIGCGAEFYLEGISIDPQQPSPAYPRWFGLDQFTGRARLTNWIVACDDLDRACATLGPGYGKPIDLQRGDLRWRMAVPEFGILPYDGFAPAVIEWSGSEHPAPKLPDSGIRFSTLVIHHPNAQQLQAQITPYLSDDRISFQTGPAALVASFETPHGMKKLT